MTSRERVHAAARGLPVDRVPVFFWINAHAGCRLMASYRPGRSRGVTRLARFLWNRFERPGDQEIPEIWRFLPLLFDVHSFNWANEYGLALGGDMVLVSFATPWRYARYSYREGHLRVKDLYGVGRALGGGIYPDAVEPVIKDVNDLRNYRPPDIRDDRLYRVFRKYRKRHPEASIAAEVWGVQDFTATSMLGMERFMLFLYDHPEEMKGFLERWTDFNVTVAQKSVEAGADIVYIEDDYGSNDRPLISMKMWREFTYPGLKRLVEAAHEAGALACLHSCGFQAPFLEHYAELGIDMLQSFQPGAGNDFAPAFEKYGNRFAFVTGIDTQRGESLPPAELRREIRENYRRAAGKGRFILGTTHEIQYTMPRENIQAIFDTVHEIQEGRPEEGLR
ncbi:MAG: hypothetical protein NT009_06200 [Proteobacteria bacterium]|nr:hypothetical protein [Pseudomonadota bacterium]